MKKINFLFVLFMFNAVMAFSQHTSEYTIEVVGNPAFPAEMGSRTGDTMTLLLNFYKDKGSPGEIRQQFIRSGEDIDLKVDEYIDGKRQKPLEFVKGSLKPLSKERGKLELSSSITVSVLIDRSGSLDEQEMGKIKLAVKTLVDQMPVGVVYYSWFHDTVSSSIPINSNTYSTANFNRSFEDTDLNNAIYMKLLEFDTTAVVPNESLEAGYKRNPEISRRSTGSNYLIVLTDGQDDIMNIPKYDAPEYERITDIRLYDALGKYSSRVKVFVLGFGDSSTFFNEEKLRNIARANKNPNGYYLAKPDSLFFLFRDTIMQQISADYEARFIIHPSTRYAGQERTIRLELAKPFKASGAYDFIKGSKYFIFTPKGERIFNILLNGFVAGVVFFIIVLITIQLLLPLLRNRLFNMRYVKHYRPAGGLLKKTCPYCFEEIREGDLVVVRCEHAVHKECWNENGHVCPEFGQNCNQGKQDFFDISDPFSRKNKLFYLNWILYGLAGGFFTWLMFILLRQYGPFDQFSEFLIRGLSSSQISDSMVSLFIVKISPLFIVGIMMGLFLSMFFSAIEDYRSRSLQVIARIILRGIIGAAVGFISFLMGNIIIILIGEPGSSIWIDWIPWLFFGGLIGYSLTVKTTMHWKHGLLGGISSIIFSFFVIYLISPDVASIPMLIAFMIYGAGLGASIATIRSTAELYFIKILNGPKQGSMIAIHKWMNAQGGMNEVFIGRSNVCEIQMNWEKKFDIAEKHAKMYLHRTRKIPVLVTIQKDKTTLYDERLDMQVGKEYDLVNGTTFKIGETVFQYVEKD